VRLELKVQLEQQVPQVLLDQLVLLDRKVQLDLLVLQGQLEQPELLEPLELVVKQD
jgi:hypothetical protein